MLTHDPKFDVPLLEGALRSPAAYIGAMGSRRTHEDRLARLRRPASTDASWPDCLAIGLDLGARTPEETAVTIAAEIVALLAGAAPADGWPTPGADPPPGRPLSGLPAPGA